jgi:stage II sporulation protein Q
MYRRKLKPFVIPVIYGVIVVTLVTSIFFLRKAMHSPGDEDDKFVYVTKTIFSKDIPVMGTEKVIIRPYTDERVKIIKYFYDYQAEAEQQEKAIIYYENTYMQNSGVDYSGPESFEVVAIYDGTVLNVSEDNLLGNIIEIRHTNDLISVYQSLSEVNVKKGDTVKQGQIIGKSGSSNIALDLKDHLHLEVLYKGRVVDPETFYDKTIKDL